MGIAAPLIVAVVVDEGIVNLVKVGVAPPKAIDEDAIFRAHVARHHPELFAGVEELAGNGFVNLFHVVTSFPVF